MHSSHRGPGFTYLVAVLLLTPGFASGQRPSGAQTRADEPVTTLSAEALAQADPRHPDFLRKKLGYYGLLPLTESPKSGFVEHYRFLWERWRRPAVLIEVEYQTPLKGTYRVMVWKGTSGQTSIWEGWPGKGSWVVEKTRSLDGPGIEGFQMMIDRWHLVDEPWYDGRDGFDGSDWLLELVSRNRHHAMYRWSPETGNVRAFAVQLIEMGIDSVLVPIE